MDGAPLNYLTAAGPHASQVLPLTWGVIVVSLVVAVVVAALVIEATRRSAAKAAAPASLGEGGEQVGLNWIYLSVGISCVVLLGTAVWTLYVLAALASNESPAGLAIDVTAHQWWWEARYLSDSPSQVFVTANELHIPAGVRVRFGLASTDVIHSFWIPALAGKTDVIPGQRNIAWLEADKPGTYIGQCGEYCGAQHAHMGLRVVADSAKDFERWCTDQLRAVETPAPGSDAARGEKVFEARCGGCHRVRGTLAGGALGPDLTHLASRQTIAAGSVPNTPAYLSAWIADPQHIKPGTQMPAVPLSGPELQAVRAFLAGTN